MQSRRKSKNTNAGNHDVDNPLRSRQLHSNVQRKPTRVGSPSRDGRVAGEDTEQDVVLEGQNLQSKSKKERATHSRTAEISRAPVVKRGRNAA